MRPKLFNRFLILLLIYIVSCNTYVGNPNSSKGKGDAKGYVTIRLTDSPVDLAKSFIITVIKVRLIRNNLEEIKDDALLLNGASKEQAFEIDLPNPLKIDLLKYQNEDSFELLVRQEVELGEYRSIELILDEKYPAKLIKLDGTEEPAWTSIPSTGPVQDIIFNRPPILYVQNALVIKENQDIELLLHIDVRRAVEGLPSPLQNPSNGISYYHTMNPVFENAFATGGQLKGVKFSSDFHYFCIEPEQTRKKPTTSAKSLSAQLFNTEDEPPGFQSFDDFCRLYSTYLNKDGFIFYNVPAGKVNLWAKMRSGETKIVKEGIIVKEGEKTTVEGP